jgi:ribokinase
MATTAPAPDVIGIGHITCDIICPLSGWPQRDTKTVVPGITLAGGGPVANAIATMARLGLRTALAGKLADDLLGRFTRTEHETAGIAMYHVLTAADGDSPVSVILADMDDATRTAMLTKGRGMLLDPGELDWDWLRSASVISLDGHQMPASIAVAQAAREWPDTRIVFDAGSMRPGMRELAALADVVIASERFAAEISSGAEPEAALKMLLAPPTELAIVTLGARGSLLADNTGIHRIPAFPVAARDTTGAGDAYHGGLVYGLLAGKDPTECARLASATAAMKCRGLGARETLPDCAELRAFIARAGG